MAAVFYGSAAWSAAQLEILGLAVFLSNIPQPTTPCG
jgi:hypothetical protein